MIDSQFSELPYSGLVLVRTINHQAPIQGAQHSQYAAHMQIVKPNMLWCLQVSSMEQEVACSAGNLMQHYEAVLSLVLGQGLTDADK